MDFEAAKENIIPLKKGRKLGDCVEDEQQRRILEAKLDHVQEEDDPLSFYVDYIDWTRRHFVSGHDSIRKITKKAAEIFRKDGRYRNDPRYIKIWMDLLPGQEEPAELFKYLYTNKIGSETALFYESYAEFYEAMSRYFKLIKIR